MLKHDPPLRPRPLDFLAVHIYGAGSRLQQAGNDVEQRRFATAGRPHHTDKFILHDVMANPVEGYHIPVPPAVYFLHFVDLYFYCTVSCHPVSFLSKNLTNCSMSIPIIPMIRMPKSTVAMS